MSGFNKLREESWQYYQTWMKETTFCPILKCNIEITRKGWDHLISGGTGRKRGMKDKINRLNLLKAAKYLIKKPTKSYIENKYGIDYTILEGNFQNKKIKVILKKDVKGKYYFFSVMQK